MSDFSGQVDPADVVMLVLSYHMGAENSCEYTRQEFVSGLERLECDSLCKLKLELPGLRKELKDATTFLVSFQPIGVSVPLCLKKVMATVWLLNASATLSACSVW